MAESENRGKNIIYVVGSSENRDGTVQNFAQIKETFENFYNCEIHNLIDRTPTEYNTYFSELKKDRTWLDKFSQCKFVAVVCLFHGENDGCIKSDSKIISLKCHFLHPLFYIQQLDRKLKWLIVQSCRGNLISTPIQPDGRTETIYLDYHMVSYCTGEGALSYQYGKGGKIFIQYVCEELIDNAKHNYEKSLVAMMNSVNDKIQQYGETENLSNFPRSEYFKNFEEYSFKSAI